jgi:hypothetical protein
MLFLKKNRFSSLCTYSSCTKAEYVQSEKGLHGSTHNVYSPVRVGLGGEAVADLRDVVDRVGLLHLPRLLRLRTAGRPTLGGGSGSHIASSACPAGPHAWLRRLRRHPRHHGLSGHASGAVVTPGRSVSGHAGVPRTGAHVARSCTRTAADGARSG